MKCAALLSGGKDSVMALHCCVAMNNDVVVAVHLSPKNGEPETDSYMYQSVGSGVLYYVAKALRLPIIQRQIRGTPVNKDLVYRPTEEDEVEDLYEVLTECKRLYPTVDAVLCGAIESNYQRTRVEAVCRRLDLKTFCPLWKIPQATIMSLMLQCGINALVIKVASLGLKKEDLTKSIHDLHNKFTYLNELYGLSMCGEGGEYETLVVDCPLYQESINIRQWNIVDHDRRPLCEVYYAVADTVTLVTKPTVKEDSWREIIKETLECYIQNGIIL